LIALLENNFQSYGLEHGFKGTIILSLLIHFTLFSILFLIPSFKKIGINSSPVISVNLVSLQKKELPPGPGTGLAESKPKPAIPDAPKEEMKVKKPQHENKIAYKKDKKVKQKPAVIKKTPVITSNKMADEEMEKAVEKIRQGILAKNQADISGSGEGKEGAGTKISSHDGAAQGTIDLKFQIYYSVIWSKIKDSWVLPEKMTSGRKTLEAIIAIRIRKDGEIVKVWTEKPSGNTFFDQSALRAIAKANPLPPVPEGYGEEYFELGIRFFPSEP